MCEYCGCQQIAVIGELYSEHDAVVALVGQIQSSLAGQRVEDVATSCQQILAILAPHTVVEEEGLFPEMTDEFPDHIEVLRSEHREIEKVLGEAAGGFPDDPTWPDRLVVVLHMLREHILKEQDWGVSGRSGRPRPRPVGAHRGRARPDLTGINDIGSNDISNDLGT